MKKFILGVIVTLVVIAGGVYFYFASGTAPVATSAQAMPFEKRMANMALQARVEKEMPKNVPIPADDTTYMAGAMVYSENCAICHGAPSKDSPLAKAMYPHPPQLFKGKGVTDDPAGETYWKVANGIRLTGMPAFKNILSDKEIWQVSVLLANADKASDSSKSMIAMPAQH